MKSLYSAYQAFEKRVIRGEMSLHSLPATRRSRRGGSLLTGLGDVLILTGLRLKRLTAAGKPMAWSPFTGSKP